MGCSSSKDVAPADACNINEPVDLNHDDIFNDVSSIDSRPPKKQMIWHWPTNLHVVG